MFTSQERQVSPGLKERVVFNFSPEFIFILFSKCALWSAKEMKTKNTPESKNVMSKTREGWAVLRAWQAVRFHPP